MRRYESMWFKLMRSRKPILWAVFLPYWMIRTPIFVIAILLRHAAEKQIDRMKS